MPPDLCSFGRILLRQNAHGLHQFPTGPVALFQMSARFHVPSVGNFGASDDEKGQDQTDE